MKYQGKTVTSRPAKQGDPGFDAAKADQIVVTLENGDEKTVQRSDTTE